MGLPIIGPLIKLIGAILGIAKKLNLGKIAQDFILKAEAMRGLSGPQKLDYVFKLLTSNAQVKKWIADLQKKALKAGLDANAFLDNSYDALKAKIEADVAALNALGLLLPHKTQPVSNTPYAALYSTSELSKLKANTG